MVLYFSGTGNSRYVAKIIGEVAKDEIISMNDRIKTGSSPLVQSEKPLVFVVPTYAWRIPRVVEQWIDATQFQGNKKAYFVMTCGEEIGNAGRYIQSLCRRKGFTYSGVTGIAMPENYVALYDVPTPPEAERIVAAAEPVIRETARKIAGGETLEPSSLTFTDKLKSKVINPVFYPFIVHAKKFYASDACISCGKCVDLCPLNNVKLDGGRPAWGGDCTHCMACICGCPTAAIEYGKASLTRPRYYLEG